MIENQTLRYKLYWFTFVACLAYVVIAVFTPFAYQHRQVILGIHALVLGVCYFVLHSTKRNLTIEQDVPSWNYFVGSVCWGSVGLIWLFLTPAVG